jgi:hypothetical protein
MPLSPYYYTALCKTINKHAHVWLEEACNANFHTRSHMRDSFHWSMTRFEKKAIYSKNDRSWETKRLQEYWKAMCLLFFGGPGIRFQDAQHFDDLDRCVVGMQHYPKALLPLRHGRAPDREGREPVLLIVNRFRLNLGTLDSKRVQKYGLCVPFWVF